MHSSAIHAAAGNSAPAAVGVGVGVAAPTVGASASAASSSSTRGVRATNAAVALRVRGQF